MTTQLVFRHLLHHRARTAVAVAGVSFAVVLIFMQLGFLGAVSNTATMIYSAMDFDIALRSPAYLHLSESRTFPRIRLDQAASLPEIASAQPLYVRLNQWQAPTTGEWRGILMIGTNPHHPAFRLPEVQRQMHLLVEPQFLLIDRMSRSDYGPADGRRFGKADIGVTTNLGQYPVTIVGHFELGTGLAANGAVILSEEGFARVAAGQTVDDVNLGLVCVAPGVAVDHAIQALSQLFDSPAQEGSRGSRATPNDSRPHDVEVLSRDQLLQLEHKRWVRDTSLGTIFTLGVVVSLFVGTAIVYQVLSTDIANMMSEYATLKAMGYTDAYLARLIVLQAVVLAFIGFLPGLLVAYALYGLTGTIASIPMAMTDRRIAGVLGLSVVMCSLSGLAALRKMRQADPADLF
ncbi:MAG: FtsX-like permease family protein [Pirellulales bacterium]|nr:FtsX-like permease family protein [Pirellulales bacterium]